MLSGTTVEIAAVIAMWSRFEEFRHPFLVVTKEGQPGRTLNE